MTHQEDRYEALAQREISATTRWGIGLIITILIQAGAIFFWAASLQSQVAQNTKDITGLQRNVDSLNGDIRAILVGIEQVKTRLGIYEDTK